MQGEGTGRHTPPTSASWTTDEYVWNDSSGVARHAAQLVDAYDDVGQFGPLSFVSKPVSHTSGTNASGVMEPGPRTSTQRAKRQRANKTRSKWYHALTGRSVPCKLEGCDEVCGSAYSARSRICKKHQKMMETLVDGELQRFCHKCTKFHPLSDFAKSNHTCVAWLAKVKSGKVGKDKEAAKMAVKQKTGAATASAELLTATAPQDAVLAGGHVPQEDEERQEDKERTTEAPWDVVARQHIFNMSDVAQIDKEIERLKKRRDEYVHGGAPGAAMTGAQSSLWSSYGSGVQSQHGMAPQGFGFGTDVMCEHIAAPPGQGNAVNGDGFDMFRDWGDYFDLGHDDTQNVPSMYPRRQQQQQEQQHGLKQGDDITTTDDQFFSFKPSDTNEVFTSPKFAFTGRQPGLVFGNFVKHERDDNFGSNYSMREAGGTSRASEGNHGNSEELFSHAIKLKGFNPEDLPSEGLFAGLSSYTREVPRMFTSSAQPGCTLVKMTYTISADEAKRLRREGPIALADNIVKGPLGRRGDFTAGIMMTEEEEEEGEEGAAKNVPYLVEATVASGSSDLLNQASRFTFETKPALLEDGVALAGPIATSLSAGLSIFSKPCVCSAEARSVIVRLPCALPAGCKIECRARGTIVPVECTDIQYSRGGEHLLQVLLPRTHIEGPALLELVRESDAMPLGVPPAVLLFASDHAVVSAVNKALESECHLGESNGFSSCSTALPSDRRPPPVPRASNAPSRSSLYVLGNAMIGRAPRYRVTAILRWACQLRVPGVGDESQQQGEEEHVQDNNVIDPLVDLLLTLYPPIEKRVAACLLLAAVMTESLGRVMLVLHHVCPHIASYGDDKATALIRGVGGRAEQQEEQDQERVDRLVEQGVALIPHRTTGGKVITALHMAAMLKDGDIACALLSTPGIARPTDWYEPRDGFPFTPAAIADNVIARTTRTSKSPKKETNISEIPGRGIDANGDDVFYASHLVRLPGLVVGYVLNDAAAVASDAMRRAAATLGKAAAPEDVVHVVFSSTMREELEDDDPHQDYHHHGREDSKEDRVKRMVMSMLLDHQFSLKLAEIVTEASASDTAATRSSFMEALDTKLRYMNAEEEGFGYISSENSAWKKYSRQRRQDIFSSLARIARCLIPDGDCSIFHADESEEAHESFVRHSFGTLLRTPSSDMMTIRIVTCLIFASVSRRAGNFDFTDTVLWFTAASTPTGFLDGSLLTRTLPSCAHVVIAAFATGLAYCNVDVWLSRRESLIMAYRASNCLALHYFRMRHRVTHPSDSSTVDFTHTAVRLFSMIIIAVVAMIRIERVIIMEIYLLLIFVFARATVVFWSDTEDQDPFYVFWAPMCLHVIASGISVAFVWRIEREYRHRVMSKQHAHTKRKLPAELSVNHQNSNSWKRELKME